MTDKDSSRDYKFFREAVYSISSSLEWKEAMESTFEFLSHHFPIDGLSMHTYIKHLKALHMLFLSTRDGVYHLDKMVYLAKKDADRVEMRERRDIIWRTPSTHSLATTKLTGNALSAYLPNKNRSRLTAILFSRDEIVGHLSMIGPEPGSFTEEHERKLKILQPALSSFMLNLLQYRKISELKDRLAEENRQLVGEVRSLRKTDIIGDRGGLQHTMVMVDQLIGQEVPVLITGETGTGKELIADAVQLSSVRSDAPYIKVNCGAIPSSLIDSELFGHEKGAFTGAISNRIGRFEQADGGTLFLDEIGDMPLDIQARLLRVLQNGIVQKIGSTRDIPVNVRIIAATNRNLEKLIEEGSFREDLYYRLNVFPIKVPPLRERKEDIVPLAHYFINRRAKRLGLRSTLQVAKASLPAMYDYPWPGNIRELENLVDRALVIDSENPVQLHHHLPQLDSPDRRTTDDKAGHSIEPQKGFSVLPGQQQIDSSAGTLPQILEQAKETLPSLDEAMIEHIKLALQLANGKIHGPGGAADLLGINPNTLRKRMDRLGILYGRKRQ